MSRKWKAMSEMYYRVVKEAKKDKNRTVKNEKGPSIVILLFVFCFYCNITVLKLVLNER
jgi:F0F1-type ATP synthase membrane subunit a